MLFGSKKVRLPAGFSLATSEEVAKCGFTKGPLPRPDIPGLSVPSTWPPSRVRRPIFPSVLPLSSLKTFGMRLLSGWYRDDREPCGMGFQEPAQPHCV